jgi:hypothetical protein
MPFVACHVWHLNPYTFGSLLVTFKKLFCYFLAGFINMGWNRRFEACDRHDDLMMNWWLQTSLEKYWKIGKTLIPPAVVLGVKHLTLNIL